MNKKTNMIIKRIPYILFALYVACAFFACKNTTKGQIYDSDSTKVSEIMSVEEAKERIYYKRSELQLSQTILLNQDNNHGNIYSATVNYLKENSILCTVLKFITKDPSAQEGGISFFWNNTPIDTLYIDDFVMDKDGNIGCKKKSVEIILYDKMWCSVLSEALQNEAEYGEFVTRCNNSIVGDDKIFEICSSALEQCKQGKEIPHIPLFYLYSFATHVHVYMDHLQGISNYMFYAFTFYDVKNKKIVHAIEEYDL